jgi:hypothetical protein
MQEEISGITEDAVVDISVFNKRVGVVPFTVEDENYPK